MEQDDGDPAQAGGQSHGVQPHGARQSVCEDDPDGDLKGGPPEGDIHSSNAPVVPHIGVSHKGQKVEAAHQPQVGGAQGGALRLAVQEGEDQLTAADTVTDVEDYIWATLTDPTPQPDAMAMLRTAYPNAMRLDYRPQGAEILPADTAQSVRGKPFASLFEDFFTQMNGRPLTVEEARAVKALREEASK